MTDQGHSAAIKGSVVLRLGDDVSTDAIYPGRYMATVLPSETFRFVFADLPEFNARLQGHEVPAGSIVAAGRNFGCGSSREQAVSSLKGHELVVAARSFARIFLQNAVNLGLCLITCPDLEAAEGDVLEVVGTTLRNSRTGAAHAIEPLAPARQQIMDAGGLIAYTRKRLLEK